MTRKPVFRLTQSILLPLSVLTSTLVGHLPLHSVAAGIAASMMGPVRWKQTSLSKYLDLSSALLKGGSISRYMKDVHGVVCSRGSTVSAGHIKAWIAS